MSRQSGQDSPLVESRYLWGSLAVVFVIAALSIRLWYVQIYKGDHYHKLSINNRIRRIEIPAPRGIIYDRNGKVLLGNRPFFDLVYIPQYVQEKDKTLQILSQLLKEPVSNFERMLRANRGRPKFLPITIKRNLSLQEVSLVESNKVFLSGIEIATAPRRDYTSSAPAHLVGYIGEISALALKEQNAIYSDNPYYPGDLIGKQGLEFRWEPQLRGQRGYRLIQVDAFGRQTMMADNTTDKWSLPVKPAVPGSDLILTIDSELQEAAKKAFQGKYGAVLVIDPRNGEILTMLSAPDFDPTIYQDGLSQDKWLSLVNDPYKPLFDKTTGGSFAPGSVYKSVIALAALEEGIVTPQTNFHCNGSFDLGRDVFHCHRRTGHGAVDMAKALMHSCDVYFYHLGVELGADKIAKYARALGLGKPLGIKLNKEDPGLIPTTAWKKKTTGQPWAIGDNPNIAIGQGANLLTPIQIVSLYSTIANEGYIWRPTVIKQINNHIGETTFFHEPEMLHRVTEISQANFQIIKKMLQSVVMSPQGTGRRAAVEGVTVGGKTGSVQVVSLRKNRNRKSSVVSMKWQEHSMFAAFSPVDQPEIAVAIVSENDRHGGGGDSAGPVAGAIINTYWNLKKKRMTGPEVASKK